MSLPPCLGIGVRALALLSVATRNTSFGRHFAGATFRRFLSTSNTRFGAIRHSGAFGVGLLLGPSWHLLQFVIWERDTLGLHEWLDSEGFIEIEIVKLPEDSPTSLLKHHYVGTHLEFPNSVLGNLPRWTRDLDLVRAEILVDVENHFLDPKVLPVVLFPILVPNKYSPLMRLLPVLFIILVTVTDRKPRRRLHR